MRFGVDREFRKHRGLIAVGARRPGDLKAVDKVKRLDVVPGNCVSDRKAVQKRQNRGGTDR